MTRGRDQDKHHERASERRSLLEVERARSAAERRLLIARELRRLATEVLAGQPSDRRSWPVNQRLQEMQRQAGVLFASATDPAPAFLLENAPDQDAGSDSASGSDQLTLEALTTATDILRRYLGLLLALRDTPAWELESARIVTRERMRLELAIEDIDQRIRAGSS
ncbi:MAG TPA: hypothetical protein VKU87_02865 [Thermomicrobiaceae bacterium]|nr:hypothetical protein [Thermomicrobiaceae bacterium]